MNFITDDITSYLSAPVQIFTLAALAFVIRMLITRQKDLALDREENEDELPRMTKRDFTLKEMSNFNGMDNNRILIGINGNVYDVTKGKSFYGHGRPYGALAGRDASRCFATLSSDANIIKNEYDDLSDLNTAQMDFLAEWELQLSEKYYHVGKLLKPNEIPTCYQTEESEDEGKLWLVI